MLQRGRGAGFLWALDASHAEAEAAWFDCVTSEPRWDHQSEERSSYYASLALRLGLSVEPLAAWLDDLRPEPLDYMGYLAVGVLGEMARRGHESSRLALRGHVRAGAHWIEALDALDTALAQGGWAGLDKELSSRFTSDELASEIRSYTHSEPWLTWRKESAHIREAFVIHDRESVERPRAEVDSSMSTATILEAATAGAVQAGPRSTRVLLSALR